MWHHAPTETTGLFQSLSVLLKRFPHGAYVRDIFFLVLQNEFPVFLMLSFICIELITINSIVLEKERKLKEYMCMMGLHSWQHWVAWFIVFFISASIVVSFMTLLFCIEFDESAVFGNSDPSLIFVFLMCFAIATIFFAFMISTFFQKLMLPLPQEASSSSSPTSLISTSRSHTAKGAPSKRLPFASSPTLPWHWESD